MQDYRELTGLIGKLDEQGVYDYLNKFMMHADRQECLAALGAAQEGMGVVGKYYEQGEYYIGDLIFAGEILSGAVNILSQILEGESHEKTGTIVIGTVQGDLHDIGKKIFSRIAEISGFEIYDLGIDVPASEFVRKAKEVNADIVGLSGILTMAIKEMQFVVEELVNEGIRNDLKVIIGGNCVNDEVCKFVGADAATKNAASGVEICRKWMEEKRTL